jgi:hypothetical protein
MLENREGVDNDALGVGAQAPEQDLTDHLRWLIA